MQTKLTLRLDDALIRKAKRYSRKSGKSVSRIVADYFAQMDAEAKTTEREISPRVRSLVGALVVKGKRPLDERDYRRYLEKKYR